MTILINGLAAVCFFAVLFLIWKLFEEIKNRGNPTRSKKPTRARTRARPVNRSLEARLLSLLQNNAQTAHRLVEHTRRRHPGRSENWYWEKAIADLERDRR